VVTVEASIDAGEIDVDGVLDEITGLRYIGKARRQLDGSWRCAADVGGALCLVEISVHPTQHIDRDPGDEDQPRRRA